MNTFNFNPEWKSPDYYFFPDDIRKYPDAWCIVVWSRRGPGKTYSALRSAYENNISIVYMKRTIDDVKFICASSDTFDMSPYVPINRDAGYQIRPRLIRKGIGGIYDKFDDEDDPVGKPLSYIMALSAVKSIKGIDLSECDWLLLDEFIPQAGEIVRHAEGEMLLDVYMTVQRDRLSRGREPLKLILFANAENISTPITNELDIVDDMVELCASGNSHLYIEERGILLHHITDNEIPLKEVDKVGIYKAMDGTAWGAKSFGGDFANNDFSNVKRISLKNASPLIHLHFRTKDCYIYVKDDGTYYMTRSAAKCLLDYDLTTENDQKLFYHDYGIDLRLACMEGRMKFQSYSMYDIIVNFKKFYSV